MRSSFLASFLFAVLAGCAGDGAGALGQADVRADCTPGDAVCAESGLASPLAEGSLLPLDVSLSLVGSGAPAVHLVSANPAVFEAEGQRLRGVRAGVAALLLSTDEGTVLDFIHVWVAQPSNLLLHRLSEDGAEVTPLDGPVQLLVGDTLRIGASFYAKTQRLIGDPEATWTVDETVLQLLEEGTAGRRRIVARAPGKTILHVEAGTLATELELEVMP